MFDRSKILAVALSLAAMLCACSTPKVPVPATARHGGPPAASDKAPPAPAVSAPLLAVVQPTVTIVGGLATIQTDPALTGPGTYPLIQVPAKGGFWPNCDNSGTEPALNSADFSCFLTKFAAQAEYANADDSSQMPEINAQDFTAFLRSFARGRRDPVQVLRGTPIVWYKPWYQCPWPADPSGYCDHCCVVEDLKWIGLQSPAQSIGIENSYYWLTIVPDSQGVVQVQCDFTTVLYTRQWRDADMNWPLPYAAWGMTPPAGLRGPWQRTDVIWPHGTPSKEIVDAR